MHRFTILLLLAACATTPHAAAPSDPTIPDGDARLGDGVVPRSYALELFVDPAKDSFHGQVAIDVEVVRPTREIRLHARDLVVTQVRAGELTGRAVVGRQGGLALVFPTDLPAGKHTLQIAWNAALAEGLSGLYRVKSGENWYAYTQFEALDARRAFPCFDEPRFKTPFTVTVHAPHGNVVVSNTPEVSSERGDTEHVTRFARTRPLPTYLVALAVGPFDVVEGPPVGAVPVRVITPWGSGDLGRFALSRVGPVVSELTAYFGGEFPFPKLDLVAVPAFGYGAMENPGMITFRDVRLLLDPTRMTEQDRMGFDGILAHELAHFWFGDLVTMAWWDDVWLNEGLATWMGGRVVQALHPGVGAELEPLRSAGEVMLHDGLGSARAVRQPIRDGGDVLTAFDGITYVKGASVLRMLEAWIGPDRFRAGINAYLRDHAEGNATTEDLLAALESASRLPVGDVARSFLDRPGVPLVTASLTCEGSRATVRLSQERYRPLGSSAGEGTWQIPVCLDLASRGVNRTQCVLMTGSEATVAVEGCPERVYPNAGETGYYRWALPPAAFAALAKSEPSLPAPEAVGLAADLDALLLAGRVDVAVYLPTLSGLLRSSRRLVVEGAVASLWRIDRAAVRGMPDREAALAKFVRQALGERGRALGLRQRAGESTDDEMLRPLVIGALAELGRDPAVAREAQEITGKWLADPATVPLPAARLAVPIASARGNETLHGKLMAALDGARTPADRALILAGLGSFRDPELLARSLAVYLENRARASDFWPLAGAAGGLPETRPVVLRWVDGRYPEIVAKLGDGAASLPSLGAGACTDDAAARLEAMFSAEGRKLPGTERRLSQAVESIRMCARLRERVGDSVAQLLAAR